MRSVIFLLLSVGFGSLSCQRLEPGQVNITCGRLKDNTAKINYFGDSIRVSAFMRNGKSCAFKQDVAKATWSLDVAFTGRGDKCVMTKMPHRHIYSIEVLSRRGSPVFESDEDEKFLMECNFETYKEEKEESVPLIDVKHPPKVVDTHEGMVSNSNYTVELVGMEGQKLKSAEVGLIVRLKVTMSPSKEEKDLGFMPVRCDVVTPDERQSSAILADGCGTGFPFDRKKGFQMIKMVGVSPPFRVFRLHPKKSVGFKCSFVTCKEDCIGSTCEVEDSNLPRLKRDAEPPKFVHATTGDTEIEGSDLNPQGELQMVAAEFYVLQDSTFVHTDAETDLKPKPEDVRRPLPEDVRRPLPEDVHGALPEDVRRPRPEDVRRPRPEDRRRPIFGKMPIGEKNANHDGPRRLTVVHQWESKIFTRNVKLAVLGTSGVVLLIFVFTTLYLLSRFRNIQ
ncbi:uncharacterized protein LOC124132260 [Haliotis rufescens]|uniref:uncharacterized protein LOC124132260 n=1 Tax=Haliotis rufescens TaxID=6454 RepID=UPI00201F0F49|nr:uncharacterized protein LOC124132260 [Haliotis rufescens]XP_046352060.2 uncharacterized protein LOC124132260 [Haliotis rufescens]